MMYMSSPKAMQPILGANQYEMRAELIQAVRESMENYGHDCDLNHLDVSRVTNFRSIFQNLPFCGNISNWDVSNAITMERMFEGSFFNGNISKWNVSNVVSMSYMFANSCFNNDISAWNVQNVQLFTYMFRSCDFSGDLSAWKFAKDALLSEALNADRMPYMNTSAFHWWMADSHSSCLTPPQKIHRDRFVPIAHGMGFSKTETAILLQEQWLESRKCALDMLILPNLGIV